MQISIHTYFNFQLIVLSYLKNKFNTKGKFNEINRVLFVLELRSFAKDEKELFYKISEN